MACEMRLMLWLFFYFSTFILLLTGSNLHVTVCRYFWPIYKDGLGWFHNSTYVWCFCKSSTRVAVAKVDVSSVVLSFQYPSILLSFLSKACCI